MGWSFIPIFSDLGEYFLRAVTLYYLEENLGEKGIDGQRIRIYASPHNIHTKLFVRIMSDSY